MIVSKDFLQRALPYAQISYSDQWRDNSFCTVCFDSRVIEQGQLFVALSGERVDGHDFIAQAIKNGASSIMIHKKIQELPGAIPSHVSIITVSDTYQALIDLAKAWRLQLTCPIVGITGSIGKTSTKEIIRSILQCAEIPHYVSLKNQNTFIGLCVNMLNVPHDCSVAVFEVGISKPGEMDIKADIVKPTIGLITCIAHSHVSEIGSIQIIAREKRQLFKYLTWKDVGIICGDQTLLLKACYNHPIAKFGFKIKNQVQVRKLRVITDEHGVIYTECIFKWYNEKTTLRVRGNHQGTISNMLGASTVAYFLKIPFDVVIKGLESYAGFENRFEQKPIKGARGRIISDCYNANPESTRAALLAFDGIKSSGKKIIVFGDMLELGEREAYWHRQMGRIIAKMSSIDTVLLVGRLAQYVAQTIPQRCCIERADDWQDAVNKLDRLLTDSQSLVLVKASHGMALDRMVNEFI